MSRYVQQRQNNSLQLENLTAPPKECFVYIPFHVKYYFISKVRHLITRKSHLKAMDICEKQSDESRKIS